MGLGQVLDRRMKALVTSTQDRIVVLISPSLRRRKLRRKMIQVCFISPYFVDVGTLGHKVEVAPCCMVVVVVVKDVSNNSFSEDIKMTEVVVVMMKKMTMMVA